ncbi:16S rRNA (guanine(966)-N(2))-methyltransferase RsmD [Sphingosinicella sp.]|uniref:16S rRNA (guanine(966)-N(2))-methyltransferase RsmD n=1 Tax=Sphingosinicella sp. TaxID=1917971 RepID=UPI0040383653
MRILAGQWRGRPLLVPPGLATRPTSDRAREGLFSMLASRLGSFEGLRVADLFAGSGALGLEALSRGAAHCLFVEKDRAAAEVLKQNIAKLGAADRAEIRVQPVEHALPPSPPADLILADPPYATPLAQMLLDRIGQGGWLAPGGWLSIETNANESLAISPLLKPAAERRFGKAHVILLTLAEA